MEIEEFIKTRINSLKNIHMELWGQVLNLESAIAH